MLPTYRKALANILVNEMVWFHAMRKDPVFLSVKTTVSGLTTTTTRKRGNLPSINASFCSTES